MTIREIIALAKSACSVPDRRAIYEWARDFVELPAAYTIRGKFDISRSRHLIEPFHGLQDDHVREETCLAPVRGGKTMLADLWVPWLVVNDPGPAMWNFPKEENATRHCKSRLMPLLDSCDSVSAMFPDDRTKKTTREITFSNGMTLMVQGTALSNLQMVGIRYLINDEPWQYEPGRLKEAYGRVGDFLKMGTSKILNLSQAGEEGDDLDAIYQAGSRKEWTVNCLGCGKPMLLKWSGSRGDGSRFGMRWDTAKRPDGMWDIPKVLPSVRFECEHCAHPHIDGARNRSEWNRMGHYVQTNPDAQRKNESFHWTALVDYPWVELVEEYLTAINQFKLGNIRPLIQFFQKRMAEPKSEGSIMEGAMQLPRAKYDVNSEWPDETHRFMTVDKQQEWYWVTIRAWSKATGQSRRLFFGKLYSYAEIEAKREEFKVPSRHVGIDCAYEANGPSGVYSACRRYKWIPFRGHDAESFVRTIRRGGKDIKVRSSYCNPELINPEAGVAKSLGYVQRIVFSSPVAADTLRGLIETGRWIEPQDGQADLDLEYKRQMADEYKTKQTDKYGRSKWVYVARTGNNHAFDCGKMQTLFAKIAEIIPDQLETVEQ